MGQRTRFRPSAVDALEERVVQSSTSSFLPTSIFQNLASAFGISSSKKPHPLTVGTLGDSYTDEYRFYPPDQSHARNWVEVLNATRKGSLSFGPFSTRSRGEPRNQGFALDWAEWGATSTDMVQKQLPGLVAQVKAGQVRIAWIFVGADDYLKLLQGVQAGTTTASDAMKQLPQLTQQAEANFKTAVNTLLAASPNLKLVVATVPRLSYLPIVQSALQANPRDQGLVDAADQSLRAYNAAIAATAAGNSRIALVDLASQSDQLAQSASGTVNFGGATINVRTPGNDYHDLFLADGLHFGTVGQGLIANDFIGAIAQFGARVRPLTPNQIVRFAHQVQNQTRHGQGPP